MGLPRRRLTVIAAVEFRFSGTSYAKMARIVQKFGGTSVADLDRIRDVAARVKAAVDAGN